MKILKSIVGPLDKQLVIEETTTDVDRRSSQAGQDVRLPASPKTGPVHIFISWALRDEIPRRELLKQLKPLEKTGAISVWAGELSLGIGKSRQIEEKMFQLLTEIFCLFTPILS